MAQQEVQQLQQQLAALQHAVSSADQLQQDKVTLQVSLPEHSIAAMEATADRHLLPMLYPWHPSSASPSPAAHGPAAHISHPIVHLQRSCTPCSICTCHARHGPAAHVVHPMVHLHVLCTS